MAEKNVSAAADKSATPSDELLSRLRLSVAGVCDIASLADELQSIGRHLHANDGSNSALVAEVLAARVSALANAVCSALDDADADLAELEGVVYSGHDAQAVMPRFTSPMVAAVLAEGAQPRATV